LEERKTREVPGRYVCGLMGKRPQPRDGEKSMSALTTSLALRAAINVLRDSAESRRMPSGEPLDDASVQLHLDAAETLEESLSALRDHE
jgi:hypothetical protein